MDREIFIAAVICFFSFAGALFVGILANDYLAGYITFILSMIISLFVTMYLENEND